MRRVVVVIVGLQGMEGEGEDRRAVVDIERKLGERWDVGFGVRAGRGEGLVRVCLML